jgi:hypothetical protein
MRMLGFAVAAIAAVTLSGCVSPGVRPNPLAAQYRATNAVDWQEMARRTVAAIPHAAGTAASSVYVDQSTRDSRFYAIYRRYLQQELFAQNYPIRVTPDGADVILRTDTDWLLHDKAGKKITDYATLNAAAVGLLGQFRHVSSLDTGFAAAIGLSAVYDFLASLDGTTRAEVVVTTSIITPRSNALHFVRSETIYVEPTELTWYMNSLPNVALPVARAGKY